MISEPS